MNLTREKMHWAGSVTTDQKEAMGQGQTKTWTLLEPGVLVWTWDMEAQVGLGATLRQPQLTAIEWKGFSVKTER